MPVSLMNLEIHVIHGFLLRRRRSSCGHLLKLRFGGRRLRPALRQAVATQVEFDSKV